MEHNIHIPNIEEIKAHVKKHKMTYAVGTTAVLSSGFTLLVARRFGIQISIAPVFNNLPTFHNDNSSLVNFGGHTTKMVKRLSDGKIWEKVADAAHEAGVSQPYMSRHLHGYNRDVGGEVYKIIGIGTTG